ncbi:Rab proteins geranylgeranyltransferase component A 1 [Phytophthora nicotianae]|uniref:Rab proteins geranylgeranyltransferase component A 1 n=1 Tax=Phytophthora nicotianae TaxID=4792 RepID=A0A0W8D4D4_PHYNI|nr:Rab proteins geranylgeranyltransferase component A 1 [Phytophthora nicotianae]
MLYDDATVLRIIRAARDELNWREIATTNGVKLRTAYSWVAAAHAAEDWENPPRLLRGGRRNTKIQDVHIDYLLGLLDDNCYLTLVEMVDALEARFGVRVTHQTVKRHVDARMYTMKQTHRDNNYRNLPHNKQLRQDYAIKLLSYKSQDLLVHEAITPELCRKCALHTVKFHAAAIQLQDMPVGQ